MTGTRFTEAKVDPTSEEGPNPAQLKTDTSSSDGGATTDAVAGSQANDSNDVTTAGESPGGATERRTKRKLVIRWPRVLAYGVLPGLALILALVAGYLKWQDASAHHAETARVDSVAAATESTIALLSYKPDTVEKDLTAAEDRLTGTFRDSYTQLIHDVVIPGATEKSISATATVPAAASVSATANHTVVLLFINQTTVIGKDGPTDTASSVRVTLDKVGDRWMISGFDPV